MVQPDTEGSRKVGLIKSRMEHGLSYCEWQMGLVIYPTELGGGGGELGSSKGPGHLSTCSCLLIQRLNVGNLKLPESRAAFGLQQKTPKRRKQNTGGNGNPQRKINFWGPHEHLKVPHDSFWSLFGWGRARNSEADHAPQWIH